MKPEHKLKHAVDRRLSGVVAEERHIQAVLHKARAQKPRRRLLPLVVAFALVAAISTALALNWPATVEWIDKLFGGRWTKDLQAGTHLPAHQVRVLGQVQYEFIEGIHVQESESDKAEYLGAGKSLYGSIKITPVKGANIVLIPEDTMVAEPIGYNSRRGEVAPPGTPSYLDKAQETNAKIIFAKAVPHGVLVDGTLQEGWEIMYDYFSYADGSLSYHFQIPMVEKKEAYTLLLRINNWEVTRQDQWLREGPDSTWLKEDWIITLRPNGASSTNQPAPENE